MSESKIKGAILPLTSFRQNCSPVWCARNGAVAFVDPGGEVERVVAAAGTQDLMVENNLLIRGHRDHRGAMTWLARELNVYVEGHSADHLFVPAALDEKDPRCAFWASESPASERWFANGNTMAYDVLSTGSVVATCRGVIMTAPSYNSSLSPCRR